MAAKEEWSISDFEIGKFIGEGKFGKVYLAREKQVRFDPGPPPSNPPVPCERCVPSLPDGFLIGGQSGYVVALKVIFKAKLEKYRSHAHLRREIEIQHGLDHPNVLRLFAWFHDETRVFLVLEYAARGELYKLLKSLHHFSEKRAATYVSSLAGALAYCHEKHVIHRDIKPENLLLDIEVCALLLLLLLRLGPNECIKHDMFLFWQGRLKIADFGWAVQSNAKRHTMCGTIDYLAPEMVEKKEHDHAVDNWTLGILCYEFLYGVPPFEAEDEYVTFRR
ncbi:hypothetical protein BHE74_00005200 [Ensete ventricosum]|nr:hypothetical protein GW17_00034975 [Ensete ventricosum]RWW86080.1 hypothetical protein BHE74_00005200 [Ensete ventricosum]RZR83038.1 hypothetical protein BHM03_00009587 [Ensete ventricosum]